MKGALIELLARGKQDELILTSNPNISHFQKVYKKANNYVRFETEQTTMSQAAFGQTMICDIEKNGDLLTNIMLEISLPATGSANTSWINSIGIYIIKEVRLKIGGITIDKYTPEYIDSYYKYSLQLGRYAAYTEMIQNYSGYLKNTNVSENKLYVPLPFWFSKDIGNAFPLILLGYMDIKLEVEFKSLSECLFNDTDTISITGLQITDCRVFTEMIYLPKEERCKFLALKEYDYLIEQHQHFIYSVSSNELIKNIKFNFNNPVKEIMWLYRDEYHKNRNEWEKYTLRQISGDEVSPINDAQLLINGLDRTLKRSGEYYRLVQPFRHHISTLTDYYYFLSFCEEPDNFQPSGHINMSLIDSAQLNLTMTSDINNGEIYLYATNYNYLRFKNGMAGLLYN